MQSNKSGSDPRRFLARGLVLAVTLHAFEQIAIVAILEDVVQDLNGRDFSGIVFGVYLLASILAAVIAGEHIDRRGPAFSFGVGLFLFTGGLVLATVSQTIGVFIVARAIQGAGGGLILTVAYAAVNIAYDENERPNVLAALSMAWIIPGLLGPPIAAALAEYLFLKWRSVFVILIPLVPIVAYLAVPAMRSVRPNVAPVPTGLAPARISPRTRLAILLCAGTALLQAGSVQANVYLLLPILLIGGGLTLFALQRLMPAGTLRLLPVLPAAIALKLSSHFAFFGTDSFVPFALQEVRGVSLFYASLAIAPASLTWALASVLVARFKKQTPRYITFVRWGFVVLAAGIALLLPTLHPEVPTELAFVAWAIAGLGVGLAYISLNAMAMNQTTKDTSSETQESAGTHQATESDEGVGHTAVALNIADSLGFAFGSTVTGAILFHGARAGFSTTEQFSTAWLINLSVALLCALAAGRLMRRHESG